MSDNPTKLKDLDAEQAVLVGILKDLDNIDKAMLNCNPTYFTDVLNRNLFKIITQAYSRYGSLLTQEFLSNVLEANGYQQDLRLVYLKAVDDLMKIEVTTAEFGFGLMALRRAFIASSVSDILTAGTQVLEAKGGQQAFDVVDKKMYDLKLHTAENSGLIIQDDREVEGIIALLKDMREHPEKYRGIPTGLTAVDQVTGGFQPGEYVLICAKSGGGKTISMINLATFAQKKGFNVVYVTIEMTGFEIRLRKFSLESGLPYQRIRQALLTPEEVVRMDQTWRETTAKHETVFHIIDTPVCTVGFIEAQLRQLKQNMKVDIVFVDYLGRLTPETRTASSPIWERASAISNDLAEMARTLKIVVVSALQLNERGLSKSAKDDLSIGDIALAKAIVNPAHAVIGMIWDQHVDKNLIRLSSPKCRGGLIPSTNLWCDLDICKITDPIESMTQDDGTLQIPEPEL